MRQNAHARTAHPLPTMGAWSPELDKVFVDVSLVPRPAHTIDSHLLADAPATVVERLSIWLFLNRRPPQTLVVLGAPGSGKTTLLRHVARRVAGRALLPGQRAIPVLLEMRSCIPHIQADAGLSLPALVRAVTREIPAREPRDWWEMRLRRGRCVILLDGLDEMAAARSCGRRRVAGAAAGQLRPEPLRPDLAAARVRARPPHGCDGAAGTAVHGPAGAGVPAAVVPRGRAAGVGRQRGRGRPGGAAPVAGPGIGRRAVRAAVRHAGAARHDGQPVAADDDRQRAPVPQQIARQPGAAVRGSLRGDAHAAGRGGPGDRAGGGSTKCDQLSALAFHLMASGSAVLDGRDAEPILGAASTQVLTDAKNNGLLVERQAGVFEFAHLTFQEFLAARHATDTASIGTLVEGLAKSWWRETIVFWAAMRPADPIVTAALNTGSVAALSLAFECVEVTPSIDDRLRSRLDDVIASAYQRRCPRRPAPARRRYRGDPVSAAGHPDVGRWRRLVAGVPAGLYHLFLRDTDTPPPDRPLPENPRTQVVVQGMWGSDALRFAEWVSDVVRESDDLGPLCRLATHDELTEVAGRSPFAAGTADVAIWARARRPPAGALAAARSPSARAGVPVCRPRRRCDERVGGPAGALAFRPRPADRHGPRPGARVPPRGAPARQDPADRRGGGRAPAPRHDDIRRRTAAHRVRARRPCAEGLQARADRRGHRQQAGARSDRHDTLTHLLAVTDDPEWFATGEYDRYSSHIGEAEQLAFAGTLTTLTRRAQDAITKLLGWSQWHGLGTRTSVADPAALARAMRRIHDALQACHAADEAVQRAVDNERRTYDQTQEWLQAWRRAVREMTDVVDNVSEARTLLTRAPLADAMVTLEPPTHQRANGGDALFGSAVVAACSALIAVDDSAGAESPEERFAATLLRAARATHRISPGRAWTRSPTRPRSSPTGGSAGRSRRGCWRRPWPSRRCRCSPGPFPRTPAGRQTSGAWRSHSLPRRRGRTTPTGGPSSRSRPARWNCSSARPVAPPS